MDRHYSRSAEHWLTKVWMNAGLNCTNTVKGAVNFYGTSLFQRLTCRTTPRASRSLNQRWMLWKRTTRGSTFALYGFVLFLLQNVYTRHFKWKCLMFISLHLIYAMTFPGFLLCLNLDSSSSYKEWPQSSNQRSKYCSTLSLSARSNKFSLQLQFTEKEPPLILRLWL